jgi:peptidoglycan/xylan/chitin deacetylase (PgdA/CDA1 family)
MIRPLAVLGFILSLSLPISAQEIAITFDDAPTGNSVVSTGPERTTRLLDALKKASVTQTVFFVVTSYIDSSGADRLRRYASAGHLLANHTHRHEWIHAIGTAAYIEDIQRADSVLKTFPHYTPWFRYPFLDEGRTRSSRDSIRIALKQLHLSNGYVTIDNYDWYLNKLFREAVQAGKKVNYEKLTAVYIEHIWNSITFYDDIAKKVLGRSPKHVLLLHENDLAAHFVGDLLKFLREKHWKLITPTEAYSDPIAALVPDVLFNGQGRVAAFAYEKGTAGRQLVQEAEDEDYLDKLVAKEKIFE